MTSKHSILYDKFCYGIGCDHYVEWDYSFDSGAPPYPCVSCKLYGQSYNIDVYPDNCPYLEEIKQFEKDWEKNRIWEKLSK